MKKLVYLLAATVMIGTPSCKKIAQIADTTFSAPYSQKVNIPTDPSHPYGEALPAGGIDLLFESVDMPTNSQQYFDEYHVSGKNIKSTSMESGELTIVSGAERNFDYLDKIEVYISAESLPEVLVAYQNNIPKGSNKITLISAGQNLRQYVRKPIVTGRVKAHVNTIPKPGGSLNVNAEFNVIANALVNYDK